ncbi:MAG: hypothetical protein ACTHNQ_01240 [Microbacterium sp.]|uniref:hypothetical protein n=1 Tax=Microbacterium sp. TaxID=51671 RepID=UPI003F7E9457
MTSILGYSLQLAVPLIVDSTTYVQFSTFWATLFLCVAACSGVQQEVTRASAPVEGRAASGGVLRRYATIVATASLCVSVIVGVAVAVAVMRVEIVGVVIALTVGVVGYAVLAAVAGAMYGMRRWSGVVWSILADPVLRTVTVGVVVIAAVALGRTPDLIPLMFAVAVPFVFAAVIVGYRFRGDLRTRLALDTPVAGLLRNTMHTVVAATSTGLMVSGLPLLIGAIGHAVPASLVAGSILLVTVVRAPLISPMLALQSYLTVSFRTEPARANRRVLLISAVILGVAGFLAVVVAIWGPGVVAAVVPKYTLPETAAIVASLLSAGLVAVLCVTGAAVLALGSHRLFAAGWVVSSVVMVAVALVPLPFTWRLAFTLVVGPAVGVGVHAAGLLRARVPSRAAP